MEPVVFEEVSLLFDPNMTQTWALLDPTSTATWLQYSPSLKVDPYLHGTYMISTWPQSNPIRPLLYSTIRHSGSTGLL